jgi:hypothetical protein
MISMTGKARSKSNNETLFKKHVMDVLKKTFPGSYILKTQEVARRGVPDIICCIHGVFVAIELKRDGKKPDPLQHHTLIRICEAGGVAMWTSAKTFEQDFASLVKVLSGATGKEPECGPSSSSLN